MLEKIKSLEYKISGNGEIENIRISFNNYTGNLTGNLAILLTEEDGDLNTLSPAQLQAVAKQKILTQLAAEPEEPKVEPEEEVE